MKKRKIGVILNQMSLRSDIRLFITELTNTSDIILFGSKEESSFLGTTSFELREGKRVENLLIRIYNRILKELYYFFGKLPSKRKEYENLQVSIINKQTNKKMIKKGLIKHRIKMILPHFLSFDLYLKLLLTGRYETSDIDSFIAFTELNNDDLISQIIKEGKIINAYVYSWDHITKFKKYLKDNVKYITWNDLIREDLINIHRIKANKIETLGASQFYFIKEYLNIKKKQETIKKYIYFPCSFGYPKIAKQEVKIIKLVSEKLRKINSEIKIIIRAYPMLQDWGVYDSLKDKSNIIFDNYDKEGNTILCKENHLYKSEMIDNALAVLHTGTTIGLEASYFNTPVIYLNIKDINYELDLSDKDHIFHAWNQYHLKKYYNLPKNKSVVKNTTDLEDVLVKISNNNFDTFFQYNKTLSEYSPLMNIKTFTNEFLYIISNNAS